MNNQPEQDVNKEVEEIVVEQETNMGQTEVSQNKAIYLAGKLS